MHQQFTIYSVWTLIFVIFAYIENDVQNGGN